MNIPLRNQFLKLLDDLKYDWKYRIRETEDDVGLLTVKYGETNVALYLEKTLIGVSEVQTAQELFDFFNRNRNTLAREAWALWQDRMSRFLLRRRVTWKELLSHAGSYKRPQILFALGMVRAGMYEGFSLCTVPPVLSQQKDSVSLSRIDKPGYPDKVYQFEVRR